ncbi:hypothetical protein [Cytobacillus oceanisediminis]|uniref:hypothetical protein n=1 Tax=Cytobacillus oceanisediminis TaxID=665099 RepID=UPI001FB42B34|nr:hypothetical protein [Cytobacillus oceanisediminis]UOE58143.1 hypothetical protein IRB79_26930 [Cytobacillus oceanisediminis]
MQMMINNLRMRKMEYIKMTKKRASADLFYFIVFAFKLSFHLCLALVASLLYVAYGVCNNLSVKVSYAVFGSARKESPRLQGWLKKTKELKGRSYEAKI